jgi:hypothetical protein
MVKREIIYYTDNALRHKRLWKWSQKTIKASGLPIISVALKRKLDMGGKTIAVHGYRSHTTLYTQILLGLLVSEADFVFFCEHDCLYHPSHFDFIPPTRKRYYYNNNVWKYRLTDRKVVGYDCNWLSQLCADRKLLIKHYIRRFKMIANGKRAYGWEPGSGQSKTIDKVPLKRWNSEYPNIDVRHGQNWAGVNKMDLSEFGNRKNCKDWKEISVKEIPGWDTKLLLSL